MNAVYDNYPACPCFALHVQEIFIKLVKSFVDLSLLQAQYLDSAQISTFISLLLFLLYLWCKKCNYNRWQ